MRNEEKNRRKQEGLLLITIGLLLIAAALSLVSYNLYAHMDKLLFTDRLQQNIYKTL